MTNKEIRAEIDRLYGECCVLNRDYLLTGDPKVQQAIIEKEKRMDELEKTLTYEKGQFAAIAAIIAEETKQMMG